ncbi:hypothetical protein HYO62_01255 [Aerococcaceae bacterium DSM 111022]|nr:hypothetical protein [Aerococcaceae bacterium DSM 111022]MBG9989284.1 hypothetical protein [Aerococcaceae bacterium DSM 111176]
MFNKVFNPILFQGKLTNKDYFEGWYYKQVSANQKTSLSFIPAVSLNNNDPHSFVQYILVQTNDYGDKKTQTGYLRYDVSAFTYEENPFCVKVGKSKFSEHGISINLADEIFRFNGELSFGAFHPIQSSPLQPNIMGFFGYIPKMECYHGVISMKHSLEGYLNINGEKVDFTGGRGYIEKDWGTSFPKKYIWLHSNHFENKSASLFFSIAHIPFHITEFEGFICNFVIENREYRFATYNLSQCHIDQITDNFVQIRLENKNARLEIKAQVLDQGKLIAPVKGTMEKAIKEGISCILSIKLEDKTTGEIFTDRCENAGVEIVDYH